MTSCAKTYKNIDNSSRANNSNVPPWFLNIEPISNLANIANCKDRQTQIEYGS